MGANLLKGDRSRGLRAIQGWLTNNGIVAISGGSGFTVVRNGVGDVSINLSRPGRRFVNASVTVIDGTAATAHLAKLLAVTPSGIQIATYVADAVDGAPEDVDFCFSMTVSDVAI